MTGMLVNELEHPLTVAFTVYMPALAEVTALSELFCVDETKLFGPVHEYDAPATFEADMFRVEPAHKGPFDMIYGAGGTGFTIMEVDPAGPVHPLIVAVTE